jgi:hypothetical protein
MKVRLWKNGRPKDVSGQNALVALALLLVVRGVKLGMPRKYEGGGYFAPLIRAGKVIGSVSMETGEEWAFLSALERAGSVKRKAERNVKLVVAGKLN